MFRVKKVMFVLLSAGAMIFSAGLYAQDNDNMQNTTPDSLEAGSENERMSTDQNTYDNASPEQNLGDNSSQFTPTPAITSTQIDQAFAGLEESPNANVQSQHEGIAESHARDLQTKLGLEGDSFNEIKDAIHNYLDEGWKERVELAQESGNPESYQEESADLAYLRVDLAESIKDELGETGDTQWSSHAVDFWTSLDKADFEVKAREAGIASTSASGTQDDFNQNQNQINQDQMKMENDQQNMNESGENTEMNQENTEETESSTDQGTTEDQSTDQESTDNPDQGE
jgi:hypothetical protein